MQATNMLRYRQSPRVNLTLLTALFKGQNVKFDLNFDFNLSGLDEETG